MEKVTLGDVLTFNYGKPLPKEDRSPEGRFPAYGANGVKCRTDRTLHDEPSIIVGRKGSAGEVHLSEDRFWPLDVTYFLTFEPSRIDRRYAFHLLKHLDLPALATGVKPGINRNDVYAIEASLPPLAEQKRIVAVLDEAFAAIDAAVARSSERIRNLTELFASVLDRLFNAAAAGESTEQLDDLTASGRRLTYGVVKPGPEGVVPFVRGGDVSNGRIAITRLRTITEEVSEQYKRTLLEGGEVLISLVGQPGETAVAPPELAGANIARQVGLIRLGSKISAEYLCFYLRSASGRASLRNQEGGSVQQVINLRELRAIKIPVAPHPKQSQIVAKANECEAATRKALDLEHAKRSLLDELRRSLLHRAFTGQLTSAGDDTP